MNRISPLFFIFALLVILVADTYIGDVPALLSQAPTSDDIQAVSIATLDGTVSYHQIVPLAGDASLTVLLKEICQVDGQEIVLGGQTLATAGRSISLPFAIPYHPASIKPDGVYVVEARILSEGRATFELAARPMVAPLEGNTVELVLTRVSPWTPLEIAITSGRLSRSGIGLPQLFSPLVTVSAP